MSDSTPGVKVRARQRSDAADDFVAGVDVDARLLVVHMQKLQIGLDRALSATFLRRLSPSAACQ